LVYTLHLSNHKMWSTKSVQKY